MPPKRKIPKSAAQLKREKEALKRARELRIRLWKSWGWVGEGEIGDL